MKHKTSTHNEEDGFIQADDETEKLRRMSAIQQFSLGLHVSSLPEGAQAAINNARLDILNAMEKHPYDVAAIALAMIGSAISCEYGGAEVENENKPKETQ